MNKMNGKGNRETRKCFVELGNKVTGRTALKSIVTGRPIVVQKGPF